VQVAALPSFFRWSLPAALFAVLVFVACSSAEEPDYCATHPYETVCGGGCTSGDCARPSCLSNADCPSSTPICVVASGVCEARSTSSDASATSDATTSDASVGTKDDAALEAATEAATDTSDGGDAGPDGSDGSM
jgi:hypothetical protein